MVLRHCSPIGAVASLKGLTVPTILVADDNSNIQKMVSLVFKEKGIDVVAVGNGEAACRKVPEVHPDVVLADVFMPVRNGYEVCEFVKQDPQFAETPVILLVGAFDPLDEKEAQRVGANGVLKKPFVPPEPLIAMVSSLLKFEPPAEEPQAAPSTEESLTPLSAAEPGPTARQAAIASAQVQFAGTDEDETVTTFTAPAAAPSPQSQEIEEDDSEPASEWAKRRATVDYEIDAADSADMVEKLAAQIGDDEPEIQAANKHVPFGGANIPGEGEDRAPKSSRRPWPEPEIELSAEPPSSITPPAEIAEFLPPAAIEEPEIATPASQEGAPSFEGSGFESSPSFLPAPPEKEPEDVQEYAPVVPDAASEAPVAASPKGSIAQEPAETRIPYFRKPFDSFPEPKAEPSFSEEALTEAGAFKAPQPASTDFAANQGAKLKESETRSLGSTPAADEEIASNKPVDQATVDDVVAKVISKLEPQLHQALANGVLRPLVEELLNQQRDKK